MVILGGKKTYLFVYSKTSVIWESDLLSFKKLPNCYSHCMNSLLLFFLNLQQCIVVVNAGPGYLNLRNV